VHFGVLYHLKDPYKAIREALQAPLLLLETQVIEGSEDVCYQKEEPAETCDQSIYGLGSRMTMGYVERVLTEHGAQWQRVHRHDAWQMWLVTKNPPNTEA
jgi:hypothetical protein